MGNHFASTTVLISAAVVRRFEYYQRMIEKRDGAAPRNTPVLLEALNATYGRYSELVAARRSPEAPSSLPFPGVAPGRRPTGAKKVTDLLAIRPTHAELRQLDEFSSEAGARSRSEFVEAVLDAFLPEAPKSFRSRRRNEQA